MKNPGKYTLLVICLFIIIGNSVAQLNIKSDGKTEGLQGKIKSIEVTKYLIKEESGQITPGELKECNKFEYNESGFLTTEEDKYSGQKTYTYRVNGQNIECTESNPKYLTATVQKKYDEKRNTQEIANTCRDTVISKITVKNIYDEKENLIEQTSYNNNGSLNYKYSFKYNENNRVIEKCGSCCNNYNDKRTYAYSASGVLTEMSYYNSKGKLDTQEKYDEKGNVVERIWYKSNGKKVYGKSNIQYEYDQQGNWVKSIQKSGPYITLRKIVYY